MIVPNVPMLPSHALKIIFPWSVFSFHQNIDIMVSREYKCQNYNQIIDNNYIYLDILSIEKVPSYDPF